jgi:cytidylate kinase
MEETTMMTLEEFDKACEAPDLDELDARQEELLRQIEFVVEMRRMWDGGSPKR